MWALVLFLLLAATPQTTRDEAIALALNALRAELDVAEDEIRVRRADPVEWSDRSLGCPAPGESYEPETTPGYQVLAFAGGQFYSVHVGNGRVVVCGPRLKSIEGASPGPRAQVEPRSDEPALDDPSSPPLRKLVSDAREDLAERLEVVAEDIELVELSEVTWPDTSLGCPQPGRFYPQVLQEGHRIHLRFGKRTFAYHSGHGAAPFLCEAPAPR